MRVPVRLRLLVPLGLLALAAARPLAAQSSGFGSGDDVWEATEPDGVAGFAGPAFVRAGWRTAVHGRATASSGRLRASAQATLHPGEGGFYPGEADGLSDLTRAVGFVRLERPGTRGLYARLGPLRRVTLGTGLVVDHYATTAAPDDQRLGAEAELRTAAATVRAFIGDATGAGVAGASLRLRTGLDAPRARNLRFGAALVHDLDLPLAGDSSFTAAEVSVSGVALDAGGGTLGPYVSAAHVLHHGSGLGVGLAASADEFSGIGRAHARLGVVVSWGRFAPGLVGAFRQVEGGRGRIVDSETYFDDGRPAELAGTPIDSLAGGLDLVADLGVAAFGRFEVGSHVRRHLGPGAVSAFGARVAAVAGGARLELAVERQGFRGLLGLVGDLGEQNTLVFDLDVPIERLGARAFVRSRYGYRRVPEADLGPDRFVIERRFEPMLGLRARL